jgi:hypothetical protein
MLKDELEAIIASDNLWAGRCTVLLALGILGEYVVLPLFENADISPLGSFFRSWRATDLKRALKYWAIGIKAVFAMMVVLGIVGEHEFSARIATNAQKLQQEADLELAGAVGTAGAAIERAAVLEKETAVLQRQLLMQDRRANLLLGAKRRNLFTTAIKSFAGQKFDIRFCRQPDSEISFLALTLMGAMVFAKWELREFSPALGCSVGVGLMLDPRAPKSTKVAAAALIKAMFNIGLVQSPDPNFLLSAGRPAVPGETLLAPSTIDTVLVDVESHP